MIVQPEQARASHRRGQQHKSEALVRCPQEHQREQWAYHDNANHKEQLKRTKTDVQLRVGSAVEKIDGEVNEHEHGPVECYSFHVAPPFSAIV
jgi:hypothetical protein